MNNQEKIKQLIEAGDKATRDGLTWDGGDFYDDNEAVDPIFHKELFCFFALAANAREAVKAMAADNELMRGALEATMKDLRERAKCRGDIDSDGRTILDIGNSTLFLIDAALKGKDDE